MLNLPIAQRKGFKSCTQHPISKFVSYHQLSHSYIFYANNLFAVEIPKDIQDTLKVPKWRKVVLEEMDTLKKNGTWSVVKLLEDKKLIGCKWVFTLKYKADGTWSVVRYLESYFLFFFLLYFISSFIGFFPQLLYTKFQ